MPHEGGGPGVGDAVVCYQAGREAVEVNASVSAVLVVAVVDADVIGDDTVVSMVQADAYSLVPVANVALDDVVSWPKHGDRCAVGVAGCGGTSLGPHPTADVVSCPGGEVNVLLAYLKEHVAAGKL